ncbi:uncharacterized protein LOC141679277 [Apium graveolens]|uniref:uncharacterized protein LOC141679277 n=1 Tax=Apium graveolens TaxID=4045 RepID=UPI003D7BCDA9
MEEAKPCSTPVEVGLKLSKDDDSKFVDPTLYRSIVGSLMYLTVTRPNITYGVSLISRLMEKQKKHIGRPENLETGRSSVGSTVPPHEEEQNADAFKSAFEVVSEAAVASEAAAAGASQAALDNAIPVNAYEAKKTLSNLGLEYTKFHACPNECVLYRGVNETASECPKCKLSRWKVGKDGRERYKIPAKVMWYFPIIPRFKRMFKSSSTAELLTWHSNQRIHDGQIRHPADSPSWRNIDYRWSAFGSEQRNLRLVFSDHGINPHNNGLTNRYSCWPVVLEEGEPNVYDAFTKTFFTFRATLLWTINDFPAYGNLWGYVNKGYLGCPVCGDDTVANYLPYSRKICYQGHRRYLPRHHPYRKKKAAFNGQQEFGQPRQPLSGQEVLAQQENIKFSYGKEVKKSKKVDCAWKKKSVFFELEYWKFHHVRHCLDIMHIEKNVCDSLVGTILNLKHKSKDSEASRLNMMEMGVRTDLAPEVGEKRTYLPPSSFTLTKAENRKVLKSLSSMKFPYEHSSNIRNCVSMADLKIFGMKSHDCHVLLQQLLPVAIRSVLPKNVRFSIIRLCFFFNTLCNKIVDVSKLDKLQADVVLTLLHLVRELRLCGPVFYRWMYPFERFNKVLKSFVRNRYFPEGCIAEAYLKEESVEFCAEFSRNSFTTAGLPKDQGKLSGPLSAATVKSVEEKERDEAHIHVLLNNSEVFPYIK